MMSHGEFRCGGQLRYLWARFIHMISVAVAVALIGVVGVSAQDRKTLISGAIYFYDSEGNVIPYPWEVDAMSTGLKARAVNTFQESEIQRPLKLISGRRTDQLLGMEVAEYTVDTSDKLKLPTVVRVSFAADVWSGILEYPLIEHLGSVDKENLKVYRMFGSSAEQVAQIRALIDGDDKPPDVYRDAYGWTVAMTNTPRGDAGRDNTEDFMLMVDLVGRMIDVPGAMDQRIAEDIANIDFDRDFEELPALDQYRVLSELGYVLARAPSPDQPIYTNYTYYDLARSAFDRAIDIAKSDSLLLSERLAGIHQERYKMSCEYGLIDRAKFLDCISDIDAFMNSVDNLPLRSRRTGLSDFEKYLYQISSAPEGKGLSIEKRQEITCDPDLSFYWAMFAGTVDASRSNSLVQATHLRSAYDFAASLGVCQREG